MPTYQLVRDGKEPKIIGDFPNMEAVHKLTIFKQHPELKQCIVEVATVGKQANRSNRWRVIMSDVFVDWLGNYSPEEARDKAKTLLQEYPHKLVRVPKYAYHKSDGPIPTSEN